MQPTTKEMEDEALWIWTIMSRDPKFEQVEHKKLNSKIFSVLEGFRKFHLDIPFIIFYRCFFYEPELSWDDVWRIYELDVEWESFSRHKLNLQSTFDALKPSLLNPELLENSLHLASDNHDLADIYAYLSNQKKVHFKEIKEKPFFKQMFEKTPMKKNYLNGVKEAKIDKFCWLVALTPAQFIDNLNDGMAKH